MHLENKHIKKVSGVIALGLIAVVLTAVFLNKVATDKIASVSVESDNNSAVLGKNSTPQFAISVDGVLYGNTDNSRGTKRITLSTTFANNSGKNLVLAPGFQMILLDKMGKSYPVTARYSKPGDVIGGMLTSGRSTKINLDYDIPASATPGQFSFLPSANSKALVVKL